MKISVIIPAAGNASRMGGQANKVLLPLAGKTVLDHSLQIFQDEAAVDEIILAARLCDKPQLSQIAAAYDKVKAIVIGGETRAASVAAALQAANEQCTHIAVHDAARPLLSKKDFQRLLAAVGENTAGAVLAAPLADSIRLKGKDNILQGIVDRDSLVAVQTPQLFAAAALRQAYSRGDLAAATDETQLVTALGLPVAYVLSRDANFKITVAEDLIAAEAVLTQRQGKSRPLIRYGLGWDSHRQIQGKPLILGGVNIPYPNGLLAHSDGDVLLHAVIDAMLGAASLPDIGRQFPDTDPAYHNISSLLLLERTAAMIQEAGWQINNIDAVIIAQAPRLAPYIDDMRGSIAACLHIPKEIVSVKAKTAEEMGLIGKGEAMAAWSIVSLSK